MREMLAEGSGGGRSWDVSGYSATLTESPEVLSSDDQDLRAKLEVKLHLTGAGVALLLAADSRELGILVYSEGRVCARLHRHNIRPYQEDEDLRLGAEAISDYIQRKLPICLLTSAQVIALDRELRQLAARFLAIMAADLPEGLVMAGRQPDVLSADGLAAGGLWLQEYHFLLGSRERRQAHAAYPWLTPLLLIDRVKYFPVFDAIEKRRKLKPVLAARLSASPAVLKTIKRFHLESPEPLVSRDIFLASPRRPDRLILSLALTPATLLPRNQEQWRRFLALQDWVWGQWTAVGDRAIPAGGRDRLVALIVSRRWRCLSARRSSNWPELLSPCWFPELIQAVRRQNPAKIYYGSVSVGGLTLPMAMSVASWVAFYLLYGLTLDDLFRLARSWLTMGLPDLQKRLIVCAAFPLAQIWQGCDNLRAGNRFLLPLPKVDDLLSHASLADNCLPAYVVDAVAGKIVIFAVYEQGQTTNAAPGETKLIGHVAACYDPEGEGHRIVEAERLSGEPFEKEWVKELEKRTRELGLDLVQPMADIFKQRLVRKIQNGEVVQALLPEADRLAVKAVDYFALSPLPSSSLVVPEYLEYLLADQDLPGLELVLALHPLVAKPLVPGRVRVSWHSSPVCRLSRPRLLPSGSQLADTRIDCGQQRKISGLVLPCDLPARLVAIFTPLFAGFSFADEVEREIFIRHFLAVCVLDLPAKIGIINRRIMPAATVAELLAEWQRERQEIAAAAIKTSQCLEMSANMLLRITLLVGWFFKPALTAVEERLLYAETTTNATGRAGGEKNFFTPLAAQPEGEVVSRVFGPWIP